MITYFSYKEVKSDFYGFHQPFLLYILSKALLKLAYQGRHQAQNTATSQWREDILSRFQLEHCVVQKTCKTLQNHETPMHSFKASTAKILATTAHAISLVRTRSQTVFSTNKIQWFHNTVAGTGVCKKHTVLHCTVLWQQPASRKKPTVKDNTAIPFTSEEWRGEANERPWWKYEM